MARPQLPLERSTSLRELSSKRKELDPQKKGSIINRAKTKLGIIGKEDASSSGSTTSSSSESSAAPQPTSPPSSARSKDKKKKKKEKKTKKRSPSPPPPPQPRPTLLVHQGAQMDSAGASNSLQGRDTPEGHVRRRAGLSLAKVYPLWRLWSGQDVAHLEAQNGGQ